jgi:hypothetical protein
MFDLRGMIDVALKSSREQPLNLGTECLDVADVPVHRSVRFIDGFVNVSTHSGSVLG